jgi:hypothetical protein
MYKKSTHTLNKSYKRKIIFLIWPKLSWGGGAIAQAVSSRRPGFKPGTGHVGICDGQKWRWGRFSSRTSVSPANLHYICFSTIIFTITRGWHNRPGMAAVLIVSQTKKKLSWGQNTPSILHMRK